MPRTPFFISKSRGHKVRRRLQQQMGTLLQAKVSPQSDDNIQQKYANGRGESAVTRSSPCNNKFF